MPTAYGYGRQSHRDQIDANEGIPNQGNRTRAHWEHFLKPKGVEHFEFIPDESAISARKNPFMARLAGKHLMSVVKPGDHFIIDKVDRLWRSNDDFVDVMRMFKEKGVTLHICNLMGLGSVTLGTPMGDFMMTLFVGIAQLESDQASDRIKSMFHARRLSATYPGAPPPIGTSRIGKVLKVNKKVVSDTRLLIWDPQIRRFMGEIVRLADEEGLDSRAISRIVMSKKSTHFQDLLGEKFFRDFIVYNGKNWDGFNLMKYYWREKQYQALPVFDPNTIRFSIFLPTGKFPFRDCGKMEPKTPNPFPFLDGRPIPTVEELRRIAG